MQKGRRLQKNERCACKNPGGTGKEGDMELSDEALSKVKKIEGKEVEGKNLPIPQE